MRLCWKGKISDQRILTVGGSITVRLVSSFASLDSAASPVVDVIKLFLEEIWISPKLRNGKKLVLMFEPALKLENNASFKQIYTLKLFIAFKMAYSCCFSFGEI